MTDFRQARTGENAGSDLVVTKTDGKWSVSVTGGKGLTDMELGAIKVIIGSDPDGTDILKALNIE